MEKVSIIMPCYNHSRYLAESIESIIAQSHEDFELIITEDCSKDNSAEIIKTYEKADRRVVGVYHTQNGGSGKSRNDAIAVATGDFIAFCDSDDLWERDKLKTQVECFRQFPEHGVIHSDSIIIDGNSKPTGEQFSGMFEAGAKLSGDLFGALCERNFINISTVIFRRECLLDGGMFEEDLGYSYLVDWIYWVTVARDNTFLYVDDVLARYRIHDTSTFHDNAGYALQMIKGYGLLLEKFPIPEKIRSRMLYTIGMQHRWLKEKKTARDYFRRSIMADPLNGHAYIRFVFQ